MSEETIVIEVEQASIKPDLIDDICNSEHSNCVVKETIDLAKDEHDDQKHAKKSLVWDVKMVDGDEADARHVRRNSASLFGENRKSVVRSRYRGGSFGSCHDMCKHGHGHTPEVKPKIYLNKTPLSLMKTASSVENRKKSVVVRRLSFPKEKPATDQRAKTVNNKQEEKSLGVDDKSSLVSSNGGFKDEEKPLGVEDKRSLVSSNGGFKDEEKSLGVDDKRSLVSSDGGFKEKPLRSKPNVKKAASMNTRVNHLKNVNHTHHQQELKGKLPEDLPEKTLYMIEPNGKCAPPETSKKAQRNRLPKAEGKSSYIGTRKGSKPTETGMSKSLFPSSSKSFKIKTEKLEDSDLVIKRSEKYKSSKSSTQKATSYTPKLKLIAPKAKQNGKDNSHLIKPLLSAVDKPSKSEEEKLVNRKTKPTTAKAKLSTSTLRPKPVAPKVKQDVEPKAKTSITRAKSQNAEGQSASSAWKMKFRRGKVVSLPTGNNTPVKLKFRRPRVLSDSCRAQSSSSNTNYKNIEGVEKDDGEEAAKVVLRRHEATSKKDDVDLNNVIEETASKLVKTRKSKVKALVGAFETVMSLRDHKAATDTS